MPVTWAARRTRKAFFDPRELPGLEVWLDALQVNGIGQAQPADRAFISTWRNLVDGGLNRTQTTLVTDSFDRADRASVNGDFTDPAPDGRQAAWSVDAGPWGIASNSLSIVPTAAGKDEYVSIESGAADHEVSVVCGTKPAAGYWGVCARYQDPLNHFLLLAAGTVVNLYRRAAPAGTANDAGTGYTLIADRSAGGAASPNVTTGTVLKLTAVGTTLTAWVDDVPVLTYEDASFMDATRVGIWGYVGSGAMSAVTFQSFVVKSVRTITTVSDAFTRANGALGNTDTGQTWSTYDLNGGIAFDLNSNAMRTTSTGAGYGIAAVETGSADFDLELTVASLTTNVDGSKQAPGVAFRVKDANNYCIIQIGVGPGASTRLWFYKKVNGTFVILGPSPQYFSLPDSNYAGAKLRVVGSGSMISAYYNGKLIQTITEGAHADATKHGVWSNLTETGTHTFDDVSIRPVPRVAPSVVWDSFERADAATLGNAESGHAYTGWPSFASTWAISGRNAYSTGPNDAGLNRFVDAGTADIDLQVTVTPNSTSNTNIGLNFRADAAAGSGWAFFLNGSRWCRVDKNGVQQFAGGLVIPVGQPCVLRVVAIGSSLWFFQDGVLVYSTTDTTAATGTFHGIWTYRTTAQGAGYFSNFRIRKPFAATDAMQATSWKQPMFRNGVGGVMPLNLLSADNAGLDNSIGDWAEGNPGIATVTRDLTNGVGGGPCLKITTVVASNISNAKCNAWIPVTASQIYGFEATVRFAAVDGGVRYPLILAQWYTAAQGFISNMLMQGESTTNAQGARTIRVAFTAPANAAYVLFYVYHNSPYAGLPAAGDIMYADRMGVYAGGLPPAWSRGGQRSTIPAAVMFSEEGAGLDDAMVIPSVRDGSPFTVYLALARGQMEYPNTVGVVYCRSWDAGQVRGSFLSDFHTTAYVHGQAAAGLLSAKNDTAANQWLDSLPHVLSHESAGTNASHKVHLDGIERAQTVLTGQDPGTANFAETMSIGGFVNPAGAVTYPYRGSIMGAFLYAGVHNDAIKMRVARGMAQRYGLTP